MFYPYEIPNLGFIFFSICFVSGISLIISIISIISYLYSDHECEVRSFRNYTKVAIIGLVLIVFGISFLIKTKYNYAIGFLFIENDEPNQREGKYFQIDEKKDFGINDLNILNSDIKEQQRRYIIEGQIIVLPWNAYVGTSIMKLNPGSYLFSFEAYGSMAKNEFSSIIVYIVEYKDKKNYLKEIIHKIELSEIIRKYEYNIIADRDLYAEIRIQLINDYVDIEGRDRNAWIKNISIKKIKSPSIGKKI